MKKRILSVLLAVGLLMTCIPFTALSVSAAASGYYIFDAISMKENEWTAKSWNSYTDSNDCFNKITVPSRGYITFSIVKPMDDYGEVSSFKLELYNSDASLIWHADTSAQKNNFSASYVYKIGLAAGTYYMNIDPSFYVTSGTISTTYKYTHTKSSGWEIESNNSFSTATTISLNKTYTGVYLDESYKSNEYQDFYKVKLTKGKEYRLIIGNAEKLYLTGNTAILKLLDP